MLGDFAVSSGTVTLNIEVDHCGSELVDFKSEYEFSESWYPKYWIPE